MTRPRESFAGASRKKPSAVVVSGLALAWGVIVSNAWGASATASFPLGTPGTAGPAPGSAAPAPGGASLAPIMVDQRQLFGVGGLPGETGAARAVAINRRIASFVSHPDRIAPVVVRIRGQERVLAVAGRDLLTVTPQDAADNLTTVPELADSWRRELSDALITIQAEHQTFWIEIRDSIVLSAEDLLRQAAAFIPRLVSALVVLFVAWYAARSVRTGVRRILSPSHLDLNTQQLILTLTYYGIWTLGWVLALGTAGIQPATLVAGLGVTTIALGFALKDLLSNFVSGFLILTTRPFSLGDQIAVKEFEGTVERIELRATHLRTADNRLIIIPNADLYIAIITNNTASPYRRQEFIVGIDYAADLNRASTMAQRVTQETPGVLADPAPDVLLDELASSDVKLKIRFHTDSRRGNATTVGSQVKQRVKEAFQAAGIAFCPSGGQIVQVEDEEKPESSSSPGSSGTDARQPEAPAAPAPSVERSSPLPAGQAARRGPAQAGEGNGEPSSVLPDRKGRGNAR